MIEPRQLRGGEVRLGDTGVDAREFFVSPQGQIIRLGQFQQPLRVHSLNQWYVNWDFLLGAMNLIEEEES